MVLEFIGHEKRVRRRRRRRSFSSESPSLQLLPFHSYHQQQQQQDIIKHCCIGLGIVVSKGTMGTKMKGIYKGFNKYISQIFVVKEHEMQIGYPTDVKHVAHIGWDSQSSSAPTWMNEFKTTSDFSSTSLNNLCDDPAWSSQDFEHSISRQQDSDQSLKDSSSTTTEDLPNAPKKQKRKKIKSTFSLKKSSSSSTSTSSRSSSSTKLQSKMLFATSSICKVESTPGLATRTNNLELL